VDITNYLTYGKLGGWLTMRDEVVETAMRNLDALAEELAWAVNNQHSQGIGLEGFSSITGAYEVADTGEELGTLDSGLNYHDRISDGTLKLWVYDSSGNLVGGGPDVLSVDADATTLTSLTADINGIGNMSATIAQGKLNITAASGYTFGFSDDSSGVLAALGINTFFEGTGAGSIGLNSVIEGDKNYITAGKINNNVGNPIPDGANSSTGIISTGGPYTGADSATYEIRISTAGAVGVAEFEWRRDGGAWQGPTVTTGGAQVIENGLTVTFGAGNYALNDTFNISVTESTGNYGDISWGNNENALAMTDLQHQTMDIDLWTCDRANGNTVGNLHGTLEDYYHSLAGNIGIQSRSISRERTFNEDIVNKLQVLRDSISGVSLDEEMTNLIEFQHAYTAAAKLITITDQMLESLFNIK
jgi:flagellar hook-associated protein 1 FlgK